MVLLFHIYFISIFYVICQNKKQNFEILSSAYLLFILLLAILTKLKVLPCGFTISQD